MYRGRESCIADCLHSAFIQVQMSHHGYQLQRDKLFS